jgi:hypothetical protein
MMGRAMRKLKRNIQNKPCLALSIPAVLCFITFVTNIVQALKDGNIDSNELHQLLASADGFETVVLCVIMMALRKKKQ